jgi:DNA polymerase (family 10)
MNTDAHVTRIVGEWKYGIRQLRRAWLTPADILNTLPPAEFLAALRQTTSQNAANHPDRPE